MVRFSNGLLGLLNLATFLLSIPIIGGGIWLANRGSTDCEKFLHAPVIVIGVFLMAVSIAGMLGAWCRMSCLLWLYLLVMFLLIVLLFCFTIFAFVVTNKGAGEVVSGRGYKEYRLGDYSHWLQKRVQNSRNWRKIRSCIQDAGVCQSLQEDSDNQAAEQFYREHLSPIQSGCCKPPTACGFTYVNATVWNRGKNTVATNDADCNTWSNNQSVLCYDCNSCKAGVLANLKKDWRRIAVVNIVVLILLIVIYSIGCCAFRNNRRREQSYFYKTGRP